MKITFPWKKALLANVNVRAEVKGEDREPASDLKFEADVPNDFLSELSSSLKSSLYFYDDARGDLADQGKKEPGFLPHLKFPRMDLPIKWNDEMADAVVAIRLVGAEGPLMTLEPVKINDLKLTPKEGGTVALSLRVQCHPTADQFGELATLVQREVEFSIAEREILQQAAA